MPKIELEQINSITWNGFSVDKRPSGLLIAARSLEITPPLSQPTIILPPRSGIQLLSHQEIIQHTKAPEADISPTHGSTDVARAINNPWLFLAQEISAKVPSPKPEVLLHLERPHEKAGYDASLLKRRGQTIRQGRIEITQTQPGAIEESGIIAMDLAKDNSLVKLAGEILIKTFSQLLSRYRINTDGQSKVPEMPDLIQSALSTLDFFPTQPNSRFAIYGMLEQITIPPTLRKEVLEKMDHQQDLDHPLAFDLTLQEAAERGSKWTLLQESRRQQLLGLLSQPNQTVFDDYRNLVDISRGLVYSGNPRNPEKGQVGLEIEFSPGEKAQDVIYSVSPRSPKNRGMSEIYFERGRGIEKSWVLHTDPNRYKEATKADNKLEYGISYLQSLVGLSNWLGDYARTIESLHLHLDDTRHPFLPNIGGLYEAYDFGREHVETRSIDESYRHNTWEIRSVIPPRSVESLHAGRVADLIEFFIGASKVENKGNGAKIDLSSQDPNFTQLLWGHIVTFFPNPQTRLAALMALHDSQALRFFNPLALIHSYQEGSIEKVTSVLNPQMKYPSDQRMLRVLEIITRGETDGLTLGMPRQDEEMIRVILGDELVNSFASPYEFIYPGWTWYEHHKERMLNQYGVKPRYSGVELGGTFERDPIVQKIQQEAQTRVEKTQTAFAHGTYDSLSPDERQRKYRENIKSSLRFDEIFLEFVNSYVRHMFHEYRGEEMEFLMDKSRKQEHLSYEREKAEQAYKLFSLFYCLENVSETLTRKLVTGNQVDFDTTFAFNEGVFFEEQMQKLFEDLGDFSDTSLNERVRRYKRMFDGMDKWTMHAPDVNRMRPSYTPALALLIWASEHNIEDPRLKPIEAIVKDAYANGNLPDSFEILLKTDFSTIPSEDLKKSPLQIVRNPA